MDTISALLAHKGRLVQGGTMVDATMVPAWASTKNKAKRRDDERHQTKKGNQWNFGMKGPIGADVNSGTVHTVSVTAANVADVSELPGVPRADDRAVFGDVGDVNNQLKKAARAGGCSGGWR